MPDIEELTNFLSIHRWWLDGFHLFDFFTKDLWLLVDEEWREFVDGASEQFTTSLLRVSQGGDVPASWPCSLREFIFQARNMRLDREVENDEELAISVEDSVVCDEEACRLTAMSRKKLHEVDRLSRVICKIAERVQADSIIDVGAGHGYLTHLLAQQNPQCRVFAIDCDDARTCGSKDRANRIIPSIHHRMPTSVPTTPSSSQTNQAIYITARLDPATLPQVLDGENTQQHVLVGLHSCGDLSGITMLRTFLECEAVKGVVVVGCCYHRVNVEKDAQKGPAGFPLSGRICDAINNIDPPFGLTYRSLTAACLTFASFKNVSTIAESMRGHYHRSLLELVLQNWPPAHSLLGKQLRVGGLSKAATKDFPSYCLAACTKLGLCANQDMRDSLMDVVRSVEVDTEGMMRRIAFVCVMKSLLGPCVESLILLDRAAYLEERLGISDTTSAKGRVWLRNLFDYATSPRNMVLVAEKAPSKLVCDIT